MKYTSLSQIPDEGVSHNPEILKQVMLRKGELPHLANFSRARFQPGQSAVAHSHADMVEVFFVESGTGVIRLNGVEKPLVRGVCVAIEMGEVHELVNNGSEELVLVYFGLNV